MARKKTVYAENGLSVLMYTPELFRRNWSKAVVNDIEGLHEQRLGFLRQIGRHLSVGQNGIPNPEDPSGCRV
jgi:hypothetical protein